MLYFPDGSLCRFGFSPPSLEPAELYAWKWGRKDAFELPDVARQIRHRDGHDSTPLASPGGVIRSHGCATPPASAPSLMAR